MKRADAKQITLSLLRWLDKRYLEKTITTEISVNTTFGSKVADVVISNGHTIAYEIKSEFDTTKRLQSQVKGFSEVFEYVYVVFWEAKFTLEELNLPDNVGAIKAYWGQDTIQFSIIKNAKINRFATPITIGHILWKDELVYFLKQKNIVIKNNYDKSKLVSLFSQNFNKTESIKIFRFVIKKRFEKGYLAYKKAKNSTEALSAFVKNKKDTDYLIKLQA